MNRLAIHSFGDVVVVHYLLREFAVSADSGEETRSDAIRISHTWQIISGMSGVQD
jgi:hypothetical protein